MALASAKFTNDFLVRRSLADPVDGINDELVHVHVEKVADPFRCALPAKTARYVKQGWDAEINRVQTLPGAEEPRGVF